MSNATPQTQPPTMQPLAVWNPGRGIWKKPHLDLFGQQEQLCGAGGYADRSAGGLRSLGERRFRSA